MRRAKLLCLIWAFLLLGGCGNDHNDHLPSAPPLAESSTLAASGLEDAGAPGAQWGVFQSMRQPKAVEEEPQGLSVYVPWGAPVFAGPNGDQPTGSFIPAEETLTVEAADSVVWFSFEGGYLYGEDLYPVYGEEIGQATLTHSLLEQRMKALEQQLPQGQYWNHADQDLPWGLETPFSITDTPCEHSLYDQLYCNLYESPAQGLFPEYDYLCQCLGFACLLSDQLFGQEAPYFFLEDYDGLRVGDHVRLWEYEHSLVVRAVDEDGVTFAEVNPDYEDCQISWDRYFTWDEWDVSYAWDIQCVITRYPLAWDGEAWQPLEEAALDGGETYSDEADWEEDSNG